MPALHNRERDAINYREQTPDDREISLGTGTILAIFFALALVCAVFFGLGYTMGRKSAQPTAIAAASSDAATSSPIFSGFKPAAGQPGSKPTITPKQPDSTASTPPDDPDATIVTTPVSPDSDATGPAPHATASTRREPTQQTTPSSAVRQSLHATPPAFQTPQASAMPAINPNGTAIVQVAAVSHQEDADVLVSALKKRGYAIFIRQEPQDHLLHVQVGPFASKKDAEAMRQRLLSDGYNAIVK